MRPFDDASGEKAGKPTVKGALLWASLSGAVTTAAVDPVQGLIVAILTFVLAYSLVRYWSGRPTGG